MRWATWIPAIIIKSCPSPIRVFLNEPPTNTGAPCLHLLGLAPSLLTLLSQSLIASWWQETVFSQLVQVSLVSMDLPPGAMAEGSWNNRSLREAQVSLPAVCELQRAPWHMSPNLIIHHHSDPMGTGSVQNWGFPAEAADVGLLEPFFFWFLSPGSTSPLTLLEPEGSFPGNSSGNL